MDKKNVQNGIVKNTLTDEKFCLDKKKLSSQIKRNIKKIMMKFFYIFCGKVFRNILCSFIKLHGSYRKYSSKFLL
jgi:hypothetical protein